MIEPSFEPVGGELREDPARVILRAARLHTGTAQVRDGWVVIEGDRIVDVGSGQLPGAALTDSVRGSATVPQVRPAADRSGAEVIDLGDVLLAPGLVDIHVHGGGGAAFTSGAAEAREALAAHCAAGTTTMMASLVTDTTESLRAQIMALVPLVEAGELAGIHLEGPWLAAKYHGAHPVDLLADPDLAQVDSLIEAGRGAVRMVTLAPERDGALAAIAHLRQAGVHPAVGHTDATYAQTVEAVAAGADVATHLFNAMRPLSHREPGPVLALLESSGVFIESVVDGVHSDLALVRSVAQLAGDRWMLVTDAMAAAGCGDGEYVLGRLQVQVDQGVARLCADGTIAGSTLTLDRAVRTAVAAGVPEFEAVRAATATPARAMGWPEVGELVPGRRADLVVLDDDLQVCRVMRAGRWR